jgi:torso-like protein
VQHTWEKANINTTFWLENLKRRVHFEDLDVNVNIAFMLQVFVYTPPIYRSIKDRLRTRGVSDLSNVELLSFFSPWSAEHIGNIQAASGNATVEEWASENLRIHFYLFTYTSLLKLHENTSLLRKLDGILGNEALLQLNLRTLSPAFKDSVKKQWFHEVIDNYLKLWEVNM